MPFVKGETGNKNGRPKQTAEQKRQKEQFQSLLRQATVPALKTIITIATSEHHKDKLNAAKYIIDKAYGANAVFLESDNIEPIQIKITRADEQFNFDEDEDEEDW